jgi:hypothetical protein
MLACFIHILFVLSIIALGIAGVRAQGIGADNSPVFGHERDLPRGTREMRFKMLLEQNKKDHDEMLKRGEEVRRLSERVIKSFEMNGSLSDEDRHLLESLEKNVKKIRDELGGDSDGEKIGELLGTDKNPAFAIAVDKLKTAATNLVNELQKTTRFSISATAIQSSNAVLTVARFLRVRK